MDVVIANKYLSYLSSLEIDISKKIEGEHDVEELIDIFKNFFFNKMIIDITSIKDFENTDNLQKLSMYIDIDKVILFLDKDSIVCKSNKFLSKLVDMGIYNFTDDKNNLMYLYNNPNSYRDVAYLQKLSVNSINNNVNILEKADSFNRTHKNVIGIKNLTESAGSTTFTYLFKKTLSNYYSVVAIELNNKEFGYFNDETLISTKEDNVNEVLDNYSNSDYILVDLGNCKKYDFCSEVLYLVEPSTIKINKLLLVNSKIFSDYLNKKIILNKSLLDKKNIKIFEKESGVKVFYNMPPLNDKEDCSIYFLPLLEKLGLVKEDYSSDSIDDNKKKSLLNFFKEKIS